MIKLTKLDKPTIIIKHAKKWQTKLLENISKGKSSSTYLLTRYSDPEIKQKIIKETSGKCAYCESKLLHTQHGDIEHIYPKSLYQSKRYEWDNLTLACTICNQNKSNKDPNLNSILNPYIDEPEKSIIFAGAIAYHSDIKGSCTITYLDLNRTELIEERNERFKDIETILNKLNDIRLPLDIRQVIYQDLISIEAHNNKKYTSMVRSAIRCFDIAIPSEVKVA
ncbi:HNH endonuclease [Acinetobacter pittii]|uniref:HNH endonuclease n=1 Tax=Acinetobacter pittii TaxID=48296 RepID=UPI003261AD0A